MSPPSRKPGAVARLRDDFRFFRRWLSQPKTTGSVVPTSWTMAQKMASVVDPASQHPVLELGPGTGIVTRAILARGIEPARLVSLEYSPEFCAQLRLDFPGVDIVQGDAFDLGRSLGRHAGATFDSVVSSLPLLNFPMEKRIALMEDLLDRVPAGRPVIQFTYGLTPSVPRGGGRYALDRHAVVLRNFPPAQLWIYRRPA